MDFTIFTALFEQLFKNPACAVLIFPISIVAFVLEKWQGFNSKYVPLVCIASGAILYPLLVRPDTVPPSFPHPYIVLVLNGLILGFVAMIIHAQVVKRLVDKFGGGGEDKPAPPEPPKE